MPRWCFSIRYCPTEILNWQRRPARLAAGVCLCRCMHHARREVRMWLVSEWLSQKKMTATDTTFFSFFFFWFQILLLYGGYPQRLPVWILPEGETLVSGRSCTSAMGAGEHHTRPRQSLGELAHLKPFKQKKNKNPWPYNASATSTLNMKQHEGRMRKLWETEVSLYQSTHEPPFEMNAAEFRTDFFAHHGGHQISCGS